MELKTSNQPSGISYKPLRVERSLNEEFQEAESLAKKSSIGTKSLWYADLCDLVHEVQRMLTVLIMKIARPHQG